MLTTLNTLHKYWPIIDDGTYSGACWPMLLKALGKTAGDDEPLSIIKVLNVVGFDNTSWILQAIPEHKRELTLFTVFCARQASGLMREKPLRTVIKTAERFANGLASIKDLRVAAGNAWIIARSAEDEARIFWADYHAAADIALAWLQYCECQAHADAAWAAVHAAYAADSERQKPHLFFAARSAARARVYAATATTRTTAMQWSARDAVVAAQSAELCRICELIDAGLDPYPT